jgi:dihydropteroate synthase
VPFPQSQVMGVLNVTPDSFSDGGRFFSHEAAIAQGRRLVGEGAHWVDVGGESTRPGADLVPVDEAAVAAGARMINDVTASLAGVAAASGAAFVAMHMQGEPRTMQAEPHYDDVVAEVRDALVARADQAAAAGVTEVWIDPGIGFGKTLEHNLDLLANLDVLVATGYPVLVGTSRKTTLGRLAARADGTDVVPPPGDRLAGSVTTAAWAFLSGVAMVRAHEVTATVRAAEAAASVREDREEQSWHR